MTEGALATELATEIQVGMTEDYIRGSLLRGLILANPSGADRVVRELSVDWNNNSCRYNADHIPGAGRPIQHDIGIRPGNGDQGLVCEIKWLSQANASHVALDLWKLALSRTISPEGDALRTYLLVGGESSVLAKVLRALREHKLNLRWSPSGSKYNVPNPTILPIEQSLAESLSLNSWLSLVSWGSNPRHVRQAPETWASLRASVRARWFRTIPVAGGTLGWRLILWELDHRSVGQNNTIDWDNIYQNRVTRNC